MLRLAAALALLGQGAAASAQALDDATLQALATRFDAIQPRMVEWRRDIHQHPELSGQEVRTAALVAEHLRKLGMEVRTGV
ncbi:MAG: amidohydrolase, partial [Proteobacteria bacterium]|nr:amidohydrolase [Pseudomonadota bacterium]